ncbi:MAG: type II TA system antitoxin MqsA family protein [Myxococcaceae bacterium]
MKCPNCRQAKMTERRENYLYTESGLSNVTLMNVLVRRCAACDESGAIITAPAALHATIARGIARQHGPITGEQLRFLRRHLGYSTADFAKLISKSRETVSRWESAGTIPRTIDLVARLMVESDNRVLEYNDGDKRPVQLRLRASGRSSWTEERPAA